MPNLNIQFESTLNEVEIAKLRCLPTVEEIKNTLVGMLKGKAPGANVLTVEIIAYHWNHIEEDIVVAISHFFMNRRMLRSFNHTLLALRPKKEARTTLAD